MSMLSKSALAALFVAASLTGALAQTATRQIVVEPAQPKAATVVAQAATETAAPAAKEVKEVETPVAAEAAPAKIDAAPVEAPKPVAVPQKRIKKFAHDYGYSPSYRPHYREHDGDDCHRGSRYSHRGSHYRSY